MSDPYCVECFMLSVLQLLKLSEDEATRDPSTTGSPEYTRKLLKRDGLQGAVLNGWKPEWLGRALDAEGA